MVWYSYVYGDPFKRESYRLLPIARYDELNHPSCLNGCIVCAILLDPPLPIPDLPPVTDLDLLKEDIAIALAQGYPYPPPGSYPRSRVLLRC